MTNGKKDMKAAMLDAFDDFITLDCLRAPYNFYYTSVETNHEMNAYGIGVSFFSYSVMWLCNFAGYAAHRDSPPPPVGTLSWVVSKMIESTISDGADGLGTPNFGKLPELLSVLP
ncbi:hypothetical protein DFH07DRAFT_765721 [Mycena maculata]|uniref:Uncharacterized protein n=1 Tax=Mycena maculata TaxID=230809 RepID=A0AAD7K6W4_9AGAR|nr:hypothetical protein DFH07DRAFT_765721 [Mycena maculata]